MVLWQSDLPRRMELLRQLLLLHVIVGLELQGLRIHVRINELQPDEHYRSERNELCREHCVSQQNLV